MLRAAVAVLACLHVARSSPSESHSLRAYTQTPKEWVHINSASAGIRRNELTADVSKILSNIEERLRVLDTISEAQAKQARRLDILQDKLDRVETTLTLKLERAQLAAERLEHRLHMLQTNVQTSVKDSSEKIERSQMKIAELTRNLTSHIVTHKHLLEKANGAYADTWHRSIMLESLMRDGLSLVNVTRRELADGLRSLARRQREARVNTADIETIIAKRMSDNTIKMDQKMQELVNVQKMFVNSCQQLQQDDPKPVADVLEKLIESLIKMKSSIFHELHKIQETINMHDKKIMTTQTDASCRRLENAFRNTSHTILKENELRQLTEKFVSLTDRADVALLRLEEQLKNNAEDPLLSSEVTAEADRLLQKLEGYDKDSESASKEYYDDMEEDEDRYFQIDGKDDIMGEDKIILLESMKKKSSTTTSRPPHQRHLHKHPYDRGPTTKIPSI